MKCTWCGYEVHFDDESEEEKQKALEEINAHALVCKKDPRTIELTALRDRVSKLEHIEAVAKDVNEWLKQNGMEYTGHQRSLETALRGDE